MRVFAKSGGMKFIKKMQLKKKIPKMTQKVGYTRVFLIFLWIYATEFLEKVSIEPARHGPVYRARPVAPALDRLLPRKSKNLRFFAQKLINYR